MSPFCWRLAAWSGALAVLAVSLLPVPAPSGVPEFSDKLVHVALYGALAFSFFRAYAAAPLLLIAAALAAYSGLIEWLQGFWPPRTPSVADFVANCTGISIMLAIDRYRRSSARTAPHREQNEPRVP